MEMLGYSGIRGIIGILRDNGDNADTWVYGFIRWTMVDKWG